MAPLPEFLLCGFVCWGLVGCRAEWVWVKEGATQQQIRQARYACEKEARQHQAGEGDEILGAIERRAMIGRCMQSLGFELLYE